ncbi:MAG: creatininase family protein [Candidatus Fermentithermobacillus carboniphilus]|uniref:Creatininase family protein n=1 Tax=Candidatus Fermentithermobacillus carboniphilus TaxID=3085328 RepID=A0AAT9LCV5_9FIRM|nr:MAG: creatininase family protein [Candidatus Fermentithermobacillus carboniphilus]
MSGILDYVELTLTDLDSLDRNRTVFFMPVSPIEVHGPHLPLGTDVMISCEVKRRVQQKLLESHPELTLVNLPPLYCGSDALPVPGSISVPAPYLSGVLLSYAKGLARQGFKYLLITDNHGGPRHQMAVDYAVRKAWSKYRFYLIDPFLTIYKYMVRHEPAFMELTGLPAGKCGDDEDNHAGTNETSLMMAVSPDYAEKDYGSVKPSLLPKPRGMAGLLRVVGQVLLRMGFRELGSDLLHLANTLAWVSEKPLVPYMGSPALASREAGESMLNAHVTISLELLERALSGDDVIETPILRSLSFMRNVPE